MKIVLAPDKFKNSLTGLEFCNAVKDAIEVLNLDVEILKLPLADGGDGTIEVVNYYLKGSVVKVEVNNPFFKPVMATYLYAERSKTAFIEMAEASGVKLLKPEQFDCKNATTLGTGEMILDAINKGATNIILGIGGSATNDCGIGMATALGYRFLDKNNKEVVPIGANLSQIADIDISHVNPNLFDVNFSIACDVTNPLHGKNGAAYIYGAQKGASSKDIEMLDKGLESFAKLLKAVFNVDAQSVKGAGAAGGMGIASKVFLNGVLEPGITLIKNLANFDSQISGADWIITGEGKLDTQTMSGKTIQGVLSSAKAEKIKVAAFCGAIDLEGNSPDEFGIQYADAIINYAKNLDDAMKNGYSYLKEIANVFSGKCLKE
ncbi:glycerate kinase [Algibacter amylolyticus]|uniref:Glycerate kinase n=1 Tax=Algibacter amylolyticus TaxID=1608400 RepID=A0A5M7BHR3_9FLAO|nr:glycerate kinase [Algibacter amylolyticus]KAA5827888.1 glycerate kinase [Algibacter amylolyticus]MBB5267119.1 glycerate kinase [Algibacter amylolyticus]TSJ82133.1 glycerate kinase [Algibacter amylolyticus]